MSLEGNKPRLDSLRELFKILADGDESAFGGLDLWSMSYELLMSAKLGGLPLIAVKKTNDGSSSRNDLAGKSALLLGLRGESPFDESRYPRLPWGRPAVSAEVIQQIEEWIADGAPEFDSEGHNNCDWKEADLRTGTTVKVQSYHGLAPGYTKYLSKHA
jgi:tyrosinase